MKIQSKDREKLLAAIIKAILEKEGETYLKEILSDANKILNKKN